MVALVHNSVLEKLVSVTNLQLAEARSDQSCYISNTFILIKPYILLNQLKILECATNFVFANLATNTKIGFNCQSL